METDIWPGFMVLHYWWELLMVSNKDKSLGVEQRSQADRLADLWRLIHNAEIKAASSKNRMLDAHTSSCHYQLER